MGNNPGNDIGGTISLEVASKIDRTDEPSSLIDEMLEQPVPQQSSREMEGLFIATLVEFEDDGSPVVAIADAEYDYVAQSLCTPATLSIGCQCAIMFHAGNPENPVIIGVLQQPVIVLGASESLSVNQDPDRIDIQSESEINLHCGKAHLRMTSEGLVEIRGRKVVSHSTGLNRIRGASVKLN
jgi:hypothetical protein